MKTATQLTAALIVCVAVSGAHAALNVVADYDFEDNATPAGFTELGDPTYSGGQLQLDGNDGLSNAATPLTATDNFAVEAIVTLTQLDAFDFAVANSNGVTNTGYGLLQDNGWQAIVMGQALSAANASPVVLNTPVALAFVRDGGIGSFYVNGAFVANLNNNPVAPTQLNIGFNPADSVATSGFNGSIDRVRLSTLSGSFNTADLLGPGDGAAPVVPAPAALPAGLALIGAIAMRRRRR